MRKFRTADYSQSPTICETSSLEVCGDRANGYNFGVLTCESCKAFFRRNAMREEEVRCPFSNNCGITSASRRFCQGCRLRKCLEVGVLFFRLSRPPAFCECICTCGFYPPNTSLTALDSIKVLTNEPLKAPLDLCITNELTLMDVVKISEAALKRIVCMARDLSAFQSLEIEDKKNIMKGIELLILRGVMAFDPSKNTWNHFFKKVKNYCWRSSRSALMWKILRSNKSTHHSQTVSCDQSMAILYLAQCSRDGTQSHDNWPAFIVSFHYVASDRPFSCTNFVIRCTTIL
ncbi:unnamed protein product [Angiostrongylus costaricensis]|uniref:Nuclear receptor domain-containing protein n=1 Tax=Angiostrongylus costaricensis TaxID=334426 RepID=A0A0R3PLQ9_ANGCS|nr:unnamed protein product [Angiostrongylus costaricensis]